MKMMVQLVVVDRMATVRNAFRQASSGHRLAHRQRADGCGYREQSLFDQARDSRPMMLEHLRSACQQWRLTLGAPG